MAAINLAIEGLPDDVHVMVHVCQGNYAIGPDYDGQIGHRYFDKGRYKADSFAASNATDFLSSTIWRRTMRATGRQAARCRRGGCSGAQHRERPQVADRIRAHSWLAPDQTLITSSCGFNHLPRHVALGKLRAMREAKAILSGLVA